MTCAEEHVFFGSIESDVLANSIYLPECRQLTLEQIKEEPDSEVANLHTSSASTSLNSNSPRSTPTSGGACEDDVIVVVFQSKETYMDQECFDAEMRRHGIQEEVLHRISRVETSNGVAIPDAQWDDPDPQLFPVSCIYMILARGGGSEPLPSTSVASSLPSTSERVWEVSSEGSAVIRDYKGGSDQISCTSASPSLPSTPELPMREVRLEDSAVVANFLTQQLNAPAPQAPLAEMPLPVTIPTADIPHPVWYRVSFIGGISVREAPDVTSACTGLTLPCNDVFGVSESFLGADQRIYLRLADGRGWVFDDSLLVPSDPSVMKLIVAAPPGNFMQAHCGSGMSYTSGHPNPLEVHEQVSSPPLPFFHPLATSPTLSTSPEPCTTSFGDVNANVIQAALVTVPYLVELPGGIPVRVAPDISAQFTGVTLVEGEVFHVSESMYGSDGQLYLRLADGRGWVMEQSTPAVMPQQDGVAEGNASNDKYKDSKSQGHVPYWVRMRRAKLTGKPLPQRKNKGAAKTS